MTKVISLICDDAVCTGSWYDAECRKYVEVNVFGQAIKEEETV